MSDFIELQMRISPELRHMLNLATRSTKFFGRPYTELVIETLVAELRLPRCEGASAEAVVLALLPPLEEHLSDPPKGFDPPGRRISEKATNGLDVKQLRDALIQFGQRHRRVDASIGDLEEALRIESRDFLAHHINQMLRRWDDLTRRDAKRAEGRRRSG